MKLVSIFVLLDPNSIRFINILFYFTALVSCNRSAYFGRLKRRLFDEQIQSEEIIIIISIIQHLFCRSPGTKSGRCCPSSITFTFSGF